MIKYFLLITFTSISIFAARREVCPKFSPLMIVPEIDVKVSFDKKSENYIYKYKISNLASAKVPLWFIMIETVNSPISIKAPKDWDKPEFDIENREIKFSTVDTDYAINPGKYRDGFEIVSKQPPGLAQVYAQGDVDADDLPTIKYDTDQEADKGDDETIACPGWYRDGGLHGDHVALFTTGPSIPNRVEAKIRMKREKGKKWSGRHEGDGDIEISPLESGKIQVMVFGKKDFDVNQIKIASLQFGRGKAKPVASKIIGEVKNDDDFDDEIKKHHKDNQGVQHLLLEFNLQDVDVKCDLDRALFLTGKIDTKDLFGAVKMSPVVCDKKTFSKEAKKIQGQGGEH